VSFGMTACHRPLRGPIVSCRFTRPIQRNRESSRRNVTSRVQWHTFSTDPWSRTARTNSFRSTGRRLEVGSGPRFSAPRPPTDATSPRRPTSVPSTPHGPLNVVGIARCAVIAGVESWPVTSVLTHGIPAHDTFNLSGALVTIDAMGSRKAITAVIVAVGGDDILAVKDYHPPLQQDIDDAFMAAMERDFVGLKWSVARIEEIHRGREEVRECQAIVRPGGGARLRLAFFNGGARRQSSC
jgi:hypothetical protein